jgi:3-oxoacyl-[acyl-carrier protein] reductase
VSKAGLIHLTRRMAVALAPETLVNCVAPGLFDGTRAAANHGATLRLVSEHPMCE